MEADGQGGRWVHPVRWVVLPATSFPNVVAQMVEVSPSWTYVVTPPSRHVSTEPVQSAKRSFVPWRMCTLWRLWRRLGHQLLLKLRQRQYVRAPWRSHSILQQKSVDGALPVVSVLVALGLLLRLRPPCGVSARVPGGASLLERHPHSLGGGSSSHEPCAW